MSQKPVADVSVIIPYYNALATVGRSLESVAGQTQSVRELIIVDDGGQDFSALELLVAEYADRLTITLLSLPVNAGAANARNVGIERASSTFIAFLDADDVWHPQKIETQYHYMLSNPVSLSAHGYIYDLLLCPFPPSSGLIARSISTHNFIWGNPIFTPTVMARKDSFVLFDPRFRRVDDYKCWYENLQNGNHALLNLALAGGYKPAIGASGLTASARLMHDSYLEVLRSLRAEGKVSRCRYGLTVSCEAVKYPIRSLLILLRKK